MLIFFTGFRALFLGKRSHLLEQRGELAIDAEVFDAGGIQIGQVTSALQSLERFLRQWFDLIEHS